MDLPNLRAQRCCINCLFWEAPGDPRRKAGLCLYPKSIDGESENIPVYNTFVCDAHIWKSPSKSMHKLALKYKAQIPEDIK